MRDYVSLRTRQYYERGYASPVIVDRMGNIYQDGRRLPVHVCRGGNGYCYCHVKHRRPDGTTYGKTCCVHTIVARAWLGQSDQEVDHIDRNPRNNRVRNLRWTSHRNNQRRRNTRRAMSAGMRRAWAGVRTWRKYGAGLFVVDGGRGLHFDTVAGASRYTGVSASIIYRILAGRYGFKSSRGYTFVADADVA